MLQNGSKPLYPGKKVLTKCHEDWAKNVPSRLFTCFHYLHIEETSPPPDGHVFSLIKTIFELNQDIHWRHWSCLLLEMYSTSVTGGEILPSKLGQSSGHEKYKHLTPEKQYKRTTNSQNVYFSVVHWCKQQKTKIYFL